MHPGDNLIIQAEVPLISSSYDFKLRLNDSNNPVNCKRTIDNLAYNCSNLTASDTGEYYIYVSFVLTDASNPQWQSNRVIIIVQCKSQSRYCK